MCDTNISIFSDKISFRLWDLPVLKIESNRRKAWSTSSFTATINIVFTSLVQFISASWPSTEYFIRNTGTGSDGRSYHFSHCPSDFNIWFLLFHFRYVCFVTSTNVHQWHLDLFLNLPTSEFYLKRQGYTLQGL